MSIVIPLCLPSWQQQCLELSEFMLIAKLVRGTRPMHFHSGWESFPSAVSEVWLTELWRSSLKYKLVGRVVGWYGPLISISAQHKMNPVVWNYHPWFRDIEPVGLAVQGQALLRNKWRSFRDTQDHLQTKPNPNPKPRPKQKQEQAIK